MERKLRLSTKIIKNSKMYFCDMRVKAHRYKAKYIDYEIVTRLYLVSVPMNSD